MLGLLLLFAGDACAQTTPGDTVICFGDSLTAGFGAQPGLSYPDYLRKDLTAAGYTVTVVNDGTTNAGTDTAVASLPAIVKAQPTVVILEYGAVDGLHKLPVAQIEQKLSSVILGLQAAKIRVLLAAVVLPPELAGAEYAAQFNAMYPALAERFGLKLVPSFLGGVYGVPALMSMDHMHPNGLGYEKVAENVLPVLEPMLRK